MRFMPCSSQSSSESAAASNEPKRWPQWAGSHRTRSDRDVIPDDVKQLVWLREGPCLLAFHQPGLS
jgi:hypothetical protein